MAISIKNHEDRITALERKSIDLDKRQVVLWSGSDSGVKKFKLSESADNFDAIGVTFNQWRIIFIPNINYDEPTTDFMRGTHAVNMNVKDRNYLNVTYNEVGQPLNRVVGLKLYYNFSYNIYRLANSISFHFLKCLINSFKGGVKEIWQLV